MNKCKFLIFMSLVLVLAVFSWRIEPVFSWDERGRTQNKEFPVVTVNHLSYPSLDYKQTRSFYVDLLGGRVVWDDGTKCQVDFGPADSPNSLYLTTGTPTSSGKVAHFAFGLPNFWELKAELLGELTRRALPGVGLDGQAGINVFGPSGYETQITAVKDPAMFPGAAGPCAVVPSAACTAAYEKGLANLGSIPGPSGTGFTALYFKYVILHVANVDAERDYHTSLMGMGILAHRGGNMDENQDDVWLRFGQNTLVLRETPGAPFSNEFGFVIENYDPVKVKAELDRRGIAATLNEFGGYEFLDPNGLKISINGSVGRHR